MADEPTNAAGEPPAVQQALSRVMRDVRALGKGDRNDYGGFNFRGIDATLNAIGPALRNHEVIVMPHMIEKNAEWLQTKGGRSRRLVTVTMQYSFIGPRGDTLDTTVVGEAADDGDKGFSKAQSVAMRVALLQTFALPTQEKDPDAYLYDLSTDVRTDAPPALPTPSAADPAEPGNWVDHAATMTPDEASAQLRQQPEANASAHDVEAYRERVNEKILEAHSDLDKLNKLLHWVSDATRYDEDSINAVKCAILLVYRGKALTADYNGLRELRDKVKNEGIDGKTVDDAHGNPTTLMNLIISRGHELKQAQDAPADNNDAAAEKMLRDAQRAANNGQTAILGGLSTAAEDAFGTDHKVTVGICELNEKAQAAALDAAAATS